VLSERTSAAAEADLAEARASARRRLRQRRWLRVLGTVLIAYGVSGIVLFALVAQAVGRPLDEAGELTVSIEGQRSAVVESLDEAVRTIDATAAGVRNMDGSLVQARIATDRAAQLSRDMAFTMYELRNQMGISLFGIQPLIGLAPGFDQMGQQMELLATDVADIGEALGANREDVATVAASMDDLRLSVRRLTTAVRGGPALELTSETLAEMRLGIFAVVGWLIALAVGCVLGGIGCWWAARRA
jgi:hypothetical protein